jgi:hypothetical protein
MTESTTRGFIRLNSKTEGHPADLRRLGYQVEVSDGVIQVEARGLELGTVDLSTSEKAEAFFRDLARGQRLCAYETQFLLPNGKTVFRFPAVRALSGATSLRTALGFDPSCLVVHQQKVGAPKASRIRYPEGVKKRRDKRAWLAEQLGVAPDGLSLGQLSERFLKAQAPQPAPEAPVTEAPRTVTAADVENLQKGLQNLNQRLSELQVQ